MVSFPIHEREGAGQQRRKGIQKHVDPFFVENSIIQHRPSWQVKKSWVLGISVRPHSGRCNRGKLERLPWLRITAVPSLRTACALRKVRPSSDLEM
jgi:hypothetical protein